MTASANKRLVLVDGSSFLFRAYHAVPPLSNAQGEPTNAILGVTNMLRKLLKIHNTDYFAVIFDAHGKNFRHTLYPQYKANRPAMPADLGVQIKPLYQLIRTMGLPVIIESGVEADDVLGTLARYAVTADFEVVISTGDKDMAQLVNEQITLENTMSNSTMDAQGVFAKFGVNPDQMIDYLALMGDIVDNIPGVPKVGSKTAAKWLGTYKTLDNLADNATQIKGKVGENLRACLSQLPLSKKLATIKCDLNLPYTLANLKCQPTDYEALTQQLTQLGFTAWLKTSNPSQHREQHTQKPNDAASTRYETVLSMTHFKTWLYQLKQAELFVFNVETDGANYMQAKITGIAFAVEVGKAAYVPFTHCYQGVPTQLNIDEALHLLKPLLENPKQHKTGHNLKYNANVLGNYAIKIQGIAHDTMLESYVLDSAAQHSISDLAKKYLNIDTIHYENIVGKGVKQIALAQVPIEQASLYGAEYADTILQLHHDLTEKLSHNVPLATLYQQIEIPLIAVLSRIERNGVLINATMLKKQSLELENHIIALEQRAYNLAGQAFNLNSPKQIQDILYEQQKLPILKKTPKGQPSTAESVLQELADNYPLPQLILEYRSISKLKSTYTDKLPQQINSKTGRIHTSYHQAVTTTGRLSSTNPNLQNIPIRTTEGRKIRQAFIATEGRQLVAADYSQIELRIMAHLSADESLLNAFAKGLDIHSATAAEVFEVAVDKVTVDLRRCAKAINFGLIYGMSAFGLAQQLGIARNQAQSYIDLYFDRYPGVKQYMDDIREQARQQGYVDTLFGRRLYLPEITSSNANRRQYAERIAINAPMQGTAADIIKMAMIEVDKWLQQNPANHKMIMQVHDELVFEVAQEQVTSFCTHVNDIMSSVAQLNVPLIVDIGVGHNWNEAH